MSYPPRYVHAYIHVGPGHAEEGGELVRLISDHYYNYNNNTYCYTKSILTRIGLKMFNFRGYRSVTVNEVASAVLRD